MNKNKSKQKDGEKLPTNSSMLGLKGRQSVRATFRLSEDSINAISILSAQLGIKQKSVFDHLMEDVQTLKDMARELSDADFDRHDRIQKSFVISRKSLSYLDMVSRKHNAPRDALVERSIRKLMPIIVNERKKHDTRKELLKVISDHFQTGQQVLAKAENALSSDDPLVSKLQAAMSAYKNALDDIVNFIDRGKLIETFKAGRAKPADPNR